MTPDLRNKKIVVVGAGRTGLALAGYFHERGAEVILSDRRPAARIAGLEPLRQAGVALDLGGHTAAYFGAADLVAISPGVPLSVPAVAGAIRLGVPVLGEVEVAFRELSAPMVAITGTNGKSTTTTLAGEIFQAWGRAVFVGGNLGTPLVEAVGGAWDWIVAELSSFQLEGIESFRPRYAMLLNISDDHLDRYPDMAAYVAAKMRIFENMTDSDVAVLNADDPLVQEAAAAIRARRVEFSSRRLLPAGMGFEGGEIVWRWGGEEHRFPARELRLRGAHNLENVMAALIPPLLEGCPAQLAWRAACSCAGLPHRMELVRELDGVAWYNDSKGTNVGSVVKSLAGLAAPVTLIAGGKDKGSDYGPLAGPLREKVAHLVLIGQAAERMARDLAGHTDTVRVETLDDAVQRARELTPSGGSVLLSPACSSFDMFANFEERGDAFCRAVNALPQREAV
ncbi:MAG: UDP-N-acetylmuramoyl-L-alanine--D-glutamate ligase [Desulfuromonas sp.]|uniref:UDP-N-acetylmuramoyl-L-alanine--D-glutamate ligase n=1 Tax=Desulfuromonas sp. TaxID=892 RepID=UPI000CAFCD00|nr:UDP-N-acetylmuramoyl-L-alanine--D-glutamate ligase [Desulfuromonas sp.]PLX81653.1 MAG: UDP-N-acetylmuramoyl-L-alanine--D-glutamate ligase [Desulfuromonas sp.]